jgi:two-component system CheB/CheR fusion protein
MAFVVITHQHPSHTSLLPELLGKITNLKVHQAADRLKVEPNHVYVNPPGGHLAILGGTLHRMETEKKEAPHLPIDYFFRSLAVDQKDKAICVVLSGTGTDGTLGLKAVKGESGMAMVQQVDSAKYAGMPSSAVATGLADYVLPAAEMPRRLLAYARGPYLAAAPFEQAPAALPDPMQKIFVLLRARSGHDFSSYKSNTILRRIERRMNLHQINEPAHYVLYLQDNPHELDFLFKELLISVTNFFRDPEAFKTLEESALPALLQSCADDYTFRMWVPGCATGEEVYSLAILMRECLETAKRHCDLQIFGTDLDNDAIDGARNGRYPEGISHDISPQRLERYFVRDDSTYRIRKDVREMAVFAVQNLIKDPPFTKLDLISCRNLLIYLNAELQHRLVPLFHYALKPGGLLFLGSSESIGGFGDLFEVVDKKWKIFRRKTGALGALPLMAFPVKPAIAALETRLPAAIRPARDSSIAGPLERLLLARFAPVSVVVSERGDVVYIHGRTGAYLEPAAGQPRLNILDMAREGLQHDLAAALRRAAAQDTEVTREAVRVRSNGDFSYVNVSVTKIHEPESVRGLLLVTFRPRPAAVKVGKPRGRAHSGREASRVEELERELRSTQESLQTTIEELETANEELKSTNEELQSTNEELQSTNEEMETSREEMQSLNEELTTVNAEMQSKVEDLSRTNDDMQNLLNSTEVATIFLDGELNIKRYTEQARQLIHLIRTDIGRPLAHLASSLDYEKLVDDCREVLRTLVFKLTEVRSKDGRWYLMRIMPYRTAENVIDGVVITLVDINPVKAAEKSLLRMSKVYLDGPEPMMMLDLAGRIIDLNDEAERVCGWSRQEMIKQPFQMIVPKSLKQTADGALGRCLAGAIVRAIDCPFVTKAGREVPGMLTLKLLTDDHGQPDAICVIAKHPPA